MERYLKFSFCGERSAYLLCVGIANHTEDLEKLHTVRKETKYKYVSETSQELSEDEDSRLLKFF